MIALLNLCKQFNNETCDPTMEVDTWSDVCTQAVETKTYELNNLSNNSMHNTNSFSSVLKTTCVLFLHNWVSTLLLS